MARDVRVRVDESHHVGQVLATDPRDFALAVNDHPIFVARNGGDESYMTYPSERGAKIGQMLCLHSGLPTAVVVEKEHAEVV